MKKTLQLVLIGAALLMTTPIVSAQLYEPVTVSFEYDRSAPIKTTYRNALKQTEKACGLNREIAPMKRALKRTCVTPILEQFVLATQDQDLIAFYERKNNVHITANRIAAH
ncbi:MAG: hypothetical protein ACE37M_13800 [Henriciella sp.]